MSRTPQSMENIYVMINQTMMMINEYIYLQINKN